MTGSRPFDRAVSAASGVIPVLFVLGIWEAIPRLGLLDPTFLPSIGKIAAALWSLMQDASFFVDIGTTVLRALCGLLLGSAVGITIGTLMAVSSPIETFFNPLVKATYSLPKTSLIPLLILWFGIGTTTATVAVMLATLLPMIVYSYHGVQGAPRILIWSARAMGTSRFDMLRRILLPSALHPILTAFRLALGFSFVIAIASEMIASKSGVGRLIFMYGENGVYDYLFASVAGVVLVAFLLDGAVGALTRRLLHWQDSE